MKDIICNKKNIYIIAAVIIIAGIIAIAFGGFNHELGYDNNENIVIYMDKEFEIKDIENIAKEVFKGERVKVEYVEEFKDTINITTREITDEKKEELNSKINEKYGTDNKVENMEVISNTRVSLFEIVKKYIIPLVIATILIIIYFAIAYRKNGVIKVLFTSLAGIVIAQLVLFSIIAIVRYPIGKFLPILILAVYIASVKCLINIFDKEN